MRIGIGRSTSRPPMVEATPLPPLSFRKTEKQCPSSVPTKPATQTVK